MNRLKVTLMESDGQTSLFRVTGCDFPLQPDWIKSALARVPTSTQVQQTISDSKEPTSIAAWQTAAGRLQLAIDAFNTFYFLWAGLCDPPVAIGFADAGATVQVNNLAGDLQDAIYEIHRSFDQMHALARATLAERRSDLWSLRRPRSPH